jgi:anti-sigma-K factor RskA
MNHPMSHRELRISLGAYLLGALDADEMKAVEAHVATCGECRAEIEQLEMLPALLDSVPPARAEALAAETAVPQEDQAPPALLARVRARRRTLRLRWGGALAGAAAASLAGGIALGPLVATAPTAQPTPTTTATPAASYQLASADGAQVDLALVKKGWGTELDLTCRGMPSTGVFSVWIVTDGGEQEQAASWTSTGYSGKAVLTGATSYQLASIRSIQIRDDAQRTLASVNVS